MREAKVMAVGGRLGVPDKISVQLVSYSAQIEDKIITHLLYIHFVALYAASEMGMGMGRMRGEGSEAGVAGWIL